MQKFRIGNKDYELSKPITRDVLDLADWAKKQDQEDVNAAYFAIAQSVVIGLKATYGSDYKKRPTYSQEKARLQAQFLAIMTQEFGKQFAEGGAVTTDVNMMTATPQGIADVNVEEMSTTQPKQDLPQLSYDEIRARLPKEISDDIVTLLANSYEALADFAEIRTQADVDAFNLKYQVQLVLPQEA